MTDDQTTSILVAIAEIKGAVNTFISDLKGLRGDVVGVENRLRTLEDKQVASEAKASQKASVFEMLNRAPGTIWAALSVGAILFAWFH